MIPVALLLRVSSGRQDTDRQEHELRQVATERGWTVIEIAKEKISGSAKEGKRHGLARVMELARAGKVKKVLVHEISRLGRRPAIVHKTAEELTELGVSLYWHSQKSETLLDDGRRSFAASMILAIMAEMAQAETAQLSERIKSGLEEAKRRGRVLGRKPGSAMSGAVFLALHGAAVTLIKKHPALSVRNLATLTGKAPGTVQKIQRVIEKNRS